MTYPLCENCARPMRIGNLRAEDHPGTVHGWSGRCHTCHRHEDGKFSPRTNVTIGTPCQVCGRAMRPSGYSAADHPGTIRHYGRGRCVTCASNTPDPRKPKVARHYDDMPITITGHDDPDVSHIAQQAQELLDDRRRRGIPPEGIPTPEVRHP